LGGEGREKLSLSKDLLLVVDDGSSFSKDLAKSLGGKIISIDESTLPSSLSGLILLAPVRKLASSALWDESSEQFIKKAFSLARRAGPALQNGAKAGGALFATVSRLDGQFGLGGLKQEQDPVFGALAGLAKTAAAEWPEVSCKAVDAACDFDDAAAVSDELKLKGPLEAGLSASGRKTLTLEDSPLDSRPTAPFAPGDVVLITGGARGVTAETAVALAVDKPTLVLWGRTKLEVEPEWAKACAGEADLKRALAGQGLAPKAIGERCRAILAVREARAQLARMEAAGAKAIYMQVDIRDAKAVRDAVSQIISSHGEIKGLVHGAGVLADKLILEKTAEQFDSVFDTKVPALRAILSALDLKKLKSVVLFSSTTARLGRTGQSDYAMANESLNKIAHLLSRRLPDCRVKALGWGPWDGGMVNDSLKKLFAKEGVAVIGLADGGRFLRDELGSGSRAAELVILAKAASSTASELHPVLERKLTVAEFPFLSSHVINGKAVLPMAVIAELFAHAALHGNPGLVFHGLDDLRIMKGVLLGAESVAVTVLAGKAKKGEAGFTVPVELRGAGGVLHASAKVVLASRLPSAPAASSASPLEPYSLTPDKAYREVLFHGPDMQFIHTINGSSERGIGVESRAALPPASWMRAPWRDRWVADPAALDSAFQAMILWTAQRQGAGCLPNRAGEFRQFASFPEGGSRVNLRINRSAEGAAAADVEFLDGQGRLIAKLSNLECTVDASLNSAFRRNALSGAL
jgi:NAD(P)-dependent dehydrogenase (short-subunit alcohol dehydrogenase family)